MVREVINTVPHTGGTTVDDFKNMFHGKIRISSHAISPVEAESDRQYYTMDFTENMSDDDIAKFRAGLTQRERMMLEHAAFLVMHGSSHLYLNNHVMLAIIQSVGNASSLSHRWFNLQESAMSNQSVPIYQDLCEIGIRVNNQDVFYIVPSKQLREAYKSPKEYLSGLPQHTRYYIGSRAFRYLVDTANKLLTNEERAYFFKPIEGVLNAMYNM